MKDFITKFTRKKIEFEKISRNYFYIPSHLQTLRKQIKQDPFSIGIFLGEEKDRKFIPSASLIDLIYSPDSPSVVVNEKTTWLFLCGRDIFGKGIVSSTAEKGNVFVLNENKEILGIGKIIAKIEKNNKVVIKNILDKGIFLRREK